MCALCTCVIRQNDSLTRRHTVWMMEWKVIGNESVARWLHCRALTVDSIVLMVLTFGVSVARIL